MEQDNPTEISGRLARLVVFNRRCVLKRGACLNASCGVGSSQHTCVARNTKCARCTLSPRVLCVCVLYGAWRMVLLIVKQEMLSQRRALWSFNKGASAKLGFPRFLSSVLIRIEFIYGRHRLSQADIDVVWYVNYRTMLDTTATEATPSRNERISRMFRIDCDTYDTFSCKSM